MSICCQIKSAACGFAEIIAALTYGAASSKIGSKFVVMIIVDISVKIVNETSIPPRYNSESPLALI
jgi:hypothetical protein